jgi:hypothetical protein
LVIVLAGVVFLATRIVQVGQSSTSHLSVAPAQLTFTCSGKGAELVLTLRNTGSAPLTWQIAAPAGLTLSAARGLLTRGASATVTVWVSRAQAAHGTLAFTSTDGAAQVPYTVTCT